LKKPASVDPAFPDQAYTTPTMMVGCHRIQYIPQCDDDEAKVQWIKQIRERLHRADVIKYPGLYDPEA